MCGPPPRRPAESQVPVGTWSGGLSSHGRAWNISHVSADPATPPVRQQVLPFRRKLPAGVPSLLGQAGYAALHQPRRLHLVIPSLRLFQKTDKPPASSAHALSHATAKARNCCTSNCLGLTQYLVKPIVLSSMVRWATISAPLCHEAFLQTPSDGQFALDALVATGMAGLRAVLLYSTPPTVSSPISVAYCLHAVNALLMGALAWEALQSL